MGEIEQLVRRAKKRDPDAFTELMQLHEKDMYRTASAILPQDADIADAIQETILTVWEKIDTLQKNRYFKTWMIRILINKCKDILRSGRRMICVEELPEQAAKDTVEAEANLEWKEALWGLDEKYSDQFPGCLLKCPLCGKNGLLSDWSQYHGAKLQQRKYENSAGNDLGMPDSCRVIYGRNSSAFEPTHGASAAKIPPADPGYAK